MGIIEDVMKALERIPVWKRVSLLPGEMDQLRARVAALEARLAPAQGDVCPKCRAPQFMLERSQAKAGPFGDAGAREHHYRCQGCGYEDVHHTSP